MAIDLKKCRVEGCADMPPNDKGYCWRHEVGIRLSRAQAGWLMYALGLATGAAVGTQENELLRLTGAIAEQLPEAL